MHYKLASPIESWCWLSNELCPMHVLYCTWCKQPSLHPSCIVDIAATDLIDRHHLMECMKRYNMLGTSVDMHWCQTYRSRISLPALGRRKAKNVPKSRIQRLSVIHTLTMWSNRRLGDEPHFPPRGLQKYVAQINRQRSAYWKIESVRWNISPAVNLGFQMEI